MTTQHRVFAETCFVAVSVALSSLCLAEAGELNLRLTGGAEAGILSFSPSNAESYQAAWRPVPMGRFGGDVQLGLTDSLNLGVGMSWALSGGFALDSVVIDGFTGQLWSRYRDLTWPVSLTLILNRGYDFGGRFHVAAGPCFVRVREDGLVDTTKTDAQGNFEKLDAETITTNSPGVFARVGAGLDWRPLDFLGGSLEVFGAFRVGKDTMAAHVGLALEPAFVVSVLPPPLRGLPSE